MNWKDIKGYEGLYKISDKGDVLCCERSWVASGNIFKKSEHLKRPVKTVYGYLEIRLEKGGYKKSYRIHRLVAQAFIPNPDNKAEINHINGDKTDNRVENLEWCTRSENIRHADKTGLRTIFPVGEKNGISKLKDSEVLEIKEFLKNGTSVKTLSKFYNVHKATIYRIKNNKGWTHVK